MSATPEHRRTEVFVDQVHAYFYPAPGPTCRCDLLIVHGTGGHGGTYDRFCFALAARGVNVWSMDLPGHGLARNASGNFRFSEWLEDMDQAAHHIKAGGRRPLFALGSSQSAAAFHVLAVSDAVDGAITMGIILSEVTRHVAGNERDGGPMKTVQAARIAATEGDERRIDLRTALDWNKDYAKDDANVLAKKLADPLRAWSYGYASYHSYWNYVPPLPVSRNDKPVLITAGGDDPLMPRAYVEECFDRIGGPKELYFMPGAGHQLMTYHTDRYVDVVDGWLKRQTRGSSDQPSPEG